MIFHDVPQATQEWHLLRRGVPTASNFKRIITPAKRQYSSQAQDYIDELIGEKLSLYGPEAPESYLTNAMRHGQETEEEARRFLSMDKNLDITNGGFCLTDDGRFGASPDGLIGEDGCAEIKCPEAKTQVAYLRSGQLPTEYVCQVQGQLLVTGRKYCLFVSYHPGLSPLLLRIEPDQGFIDSLDVALERFWADYQTALARVKGM